MDRVQTARSLLDSAGNPRITFGGQSSSSALNVINENLRSDLLALDSDIASAAQELARNRALMACQSGAFGTAISQLAASLDYIKTNLTDKVRVDLYDNRYVDTANTTAAVDTTFGQATLGITGQSDWLVATDLEGNTWIPKSTRIRYASNSDGHVPNPNAASGATVDEFMENEQFVYCLDGDPGTMWVQERTHDHVWIDIQVPTDTVTNVFANTLILRPFPAFCHDLVSVDIISQSGNVMSLTADQLKYLPGYNETASPHVISSIADVRIFFPPTQVARVRLHVKPGNHAYWGFSAIELKTTNFQATSRLVFDLNPINNGRFTNTPSLLLRGNDEPYLTKVLPSISNFKATYNLSQPAAGYTPIITAVDVSWL